MSVLLVYILKVAIIQTLLLVCYRLLLHRDTFYRMVRYYFMAGLALSYIIPLIRFDFVLHTTPAVGQPEVATMYNYLPDLSMSDLSHPAWWAQYSFTDYLLAAAILGIVVMLVRIAIQYISLSRLNINKQLKFETYSIVTVNAPIKPFSFGKRVYINPELHNEQEFEEIIQHELVHVHQRHSIDILVALINKCLFWWNPTAWLLSSAVRNNLEYIVDDEMLKQGFDRKHYQYHLLHICQLAYSNGIATHFNLSNLKRRIKMMNKARTQPFYKTKWLLLLPLAVIVAISFNVKKIAAAANDNETSNIEVLATSEEQKHSIKMWGPNVDTFTIEGVDKAKLNQIALSMASKIEGDATLLVDNKEVDTFNSLQDSSSKDIVQNLIDDEKLTISFLDFNIAGEKPLFVVDGKVINYDDFIEKYKDKKIKHIERLKDEDAVNTYGDKGKKGVMLVYVENEPPKNYKGAVIKIVGTNTTKVPVIIVDGKEVTSVEFQNNYDKSKIKSINIVKDDEELVKKYGEKVRNGAMLVYINDEPPTGSLLTTHSGKNVSISMSGIKSFSESDISAFTNELAVGKIDSIMSNKIMNNIKLNGKVLDVNMLSDSNIKNIEALKDSANKSGFSGVAIYKASDTINSPTANNNSVILISKKINVN